VTLVHSKARMQPNAILAAHYTSFARQRSYYAFSQELPYCTRQNGLRLGMGALK